MQMRLTIPRERARVNDLNASLDAMLANNGVSRGLRDDVRLIVEELASNAIEHGNTQGIEPEQHDLCVDIDIHDERLTLQFHEGGAPYNPLSEAPPSLDGDILDRPIGGLGIHLIRNLAEDLHYARIDQFNILRITLRIPTPEN